VTVKALNALRRAEADTEAGRVVHAAGTAAGADTITAATNLVPTAKDNGRRRRREAAATPVRRDGPRAVPS